MKRTALLTALALLSLTAPPVSAQLRIAPEVSWGDDVDLGIGGRLLLNLNRLVSSEGTGGIAGKLDAFGAFDYFTGCHDCSYYEITTGLLLPLTIRRIGPYIGVGANFGHFSADEVSPGIDASDTDIGLALMLGLLFPLGQQQAFLELRRTAGGGEHTVITFGVQFGGGGQSSGESRR
ncbi:MAG: hypothetical protein L0271_20080 [Gemmatimonadetes bacterium]|nr:hypothetical protein [Gemmatimonadota bacterium]